MAVDGIKRLSVLGGVGVSDGVRCLRRLAVLAALGTGRSSFYYAPIRSYRTFGNLARGRRARATRGPAERITARRAMFDHGYHAYSLFFVYAPYYLISTRRGRAIYMLAGMGLLFLLPQLAELIAS